MKWIENGRKCTESDILGSLKGLPFNICESYGLGGLLPPKTTKGLKLKVLKMQFLMKNVVF